MNYQPKPDDIPPHIQQTWTPELDALIIAERANNKSCREIAALIGRTRNAVIGRASRLITQGKMERPVPNSCRVKKPRADGHANWQEAERARIRAEADRNRALRILRAMDAPPPIIGEKAPAYTERFQEGFLGQHGRVSITELTAGMCRFPITQSTGETRYCGDPIRPGSAYCEDHATRCLAVSAPRKLGRWRYI